MANTFLPFADFAESAHVLDRERLGKQRVEVLQVLKALAGESKMYANHACTRMWRGHECQLADYGMTVCAEWVRRGYKDTCYEKIGDLYVRYFRDDPVQLAPWLGDEEFHSIYRGVLLDKDWDWYSRWGWTEKPIRKVRGSYPYKWPEGVRA